MGGVFIKKVILKLWCLVAVFCVFVMGVAGADLQCGNSQIKQLVNQIQESGFSSFLADFFQNIHSAVAKVIVDIKKVR